MKAFDSCRGTPSVGDRRGGCLPGVGSGFSIGKAIWRQIAECSRIWITPPEANGSAASQPDLSFQ